VEEWKPRGIIGHTGTGGEEEEGEGDSEEFKLVSLIGRYHPLATLTKKTCTVNVGDAQEEAWEVTR